VQDPLVDLLARARRPPRVLTLAAELAQTLDSLMARRKLDTAEAAANGQVGLLSRALADYHEAANKLAHAVNRQRTKLAAARSGKVQVLKQKKRSRR